MDLTRPRRPAARADFEIAIICALPIEADAVDALFDHHWDDNGPPYDKAAGDPNAYSTGAIGRHNVVLAHMPGMGKASAAAVAANCRASFPNIKLALVVGVCGIVPFRPGDSGETAETVLGDVIISDGVVQYCLGRRLPERFVPKDTLLDTLGRPNTEIRSLLAKLKGLRGRKVLQGKMAGYMDVLRDEPELAAVYPSAAQDRLFEAAYRHVTDGMSCEECGCNGELVRRTRLDQGDGQPAVHFGLIASGDTVMKSGKDRDDIARNAGVIGFEMEGAGVWDVFPCVVIKGACDYADSHKTKTWQRYAAATAAACMKAFLGHWVPSGELTPNRLTPGENVPATTPYCTIPFLHEQLLSLLAMAEEQTQSGKAKVQESTEKFAANNAALSNEMSTFGRFLYGLLLFLGMPWVILRMLDERLDHGSICLQGVIASDNAIVSDMQQEAESARTILAELEKARDYVQSQPEPERTQATARIQNTIPVDSQLLDSVDEQCSAIRSTQDQELDEAGVKGLQPQAYEEAENTRRRNEEEYAHIQRMIPELEKQGNRLQESVQMLGAKQAEIEAKVAELEEQLEKAERLRQENEGRTVWQQIRAWIRWLSRCGSSG